MNTPPSKQQLPIIVHLVKVYAWWHSYLPHIPKTARYNLVGKIDGLFTQTIEAIFIASRLPKEQKIPHLELAIKKLNLLTFFLQLAWEVRALDNKKYATLSEKLNEVGKMLGGWRKSITKTPPPKHPKP